MPSLEEIEKRYGPQANDASSFHRRCRLLQSWYRVEVINETQCGPFRPRGKVVGSTLVAGDHTGANFLTPAAFQYANEKVKEKHERNSDLTIDEYRLFNNMLSSQPLCFNLFSDLRAGVIRSDTNAAAVLKAVFAESPIATVRSVEVEMIPRPTREYIDDKTAFDASVLFEDSKGQRGLASIETKYTDKLGGNKAAAQERKFELADRLGLFTPAGHSWYAEHGFDQVARNLLLTHAYAQRHQLAHATNYVLGLREDREAAKAVAHIQERLADRYRDSIRLLPLETVVDRALTVADGEYADVMRRFRGRYLDFSQIAHLCEVI